MRGLWLLPRAVAVGVALVMALVCVSDVRAQRCNVPAAAAASSQVSSANDVQLQSLLSAFAQQQARSSAATAVAAPRIATLPSVQAPASASASATAGAVQQPVDVNALATLLAAVQSVQASRNPSASASAASSGSCNAGGGRAFSRTISRSGSRLQLVRVPFSSRRAVARSGL